MDTDGCSSLLANVLGTLSIQFHCASRFIGSPRLTVQHVGENPVPHKVYALHMKDSRAGKAVGAKGQLLGSECGVVLQ